MMRKGDVKAEFGPSEFRARLNLDGSGESKISSGSGFLDHMLGTFAKTGQLDLVVEGEGDLYRAETIGKAIGKAMNIALADRKGITRYGWSTVPMDEALSDISLDFSGRPFLIISGKFHSGRIGDFDLQQIKPFLEAFCYEARLTLNIRFNGENDHHQAESIFKALGLAVKMATKREGDSIPSTKGLI